MQGAYVCELHVLLCLLLSAYVGGFPLVVHPTSLVLPLSLDEANPVISRIVNACGKPLLCVHVHTYITCMFIFIVQPSVRICCTYASQFSSVSMSTRHSMLPSLAEQAADRR